MGTNGRTDGRGNGREPRSGLIDIPKLDEQRKEQIRSGILTGIRSWKKEADEPQRAKGNGRRRGMIAGGIGAGFAAAALAVVLVQTDGLSGPAASGGAPQAADTAAGSVEESGTGANGTEADGGAAASSEPGFLDLPRAPHELSALSADGAEMPEGIADTLNGLTYDEFRGRWQQNAADADEDTQKLTSLEGEELTLGSSLPRLDETLQAFGDPALGYGYTAWTDNEDEELREIDFRLGSPAVGQGQDESEAALLRFVTTVFQPELSETERAKVLDQLRFRDYERAGGYRMSESGGLLYTLDRSGERAMLIVQFLRRDDQPDALGKWQDSLLESVRGAVKGAETGSQTDSGTGSGK
ncbi:hypothetical protein QWJ34_16105 [Saccharibacillus sp. CPCC 101409]|uniref:hypothetical protein n=1 Tax=Saccharibacillus sp. CPCC 101409 TaxID=3058041 RepID=UPI00267335DA|nr:hypothetical protein [Saccharibacillus sp. CPCC 101409]MDO3411289.1 hypothetical protein [Saccharibacillus sp. CPCC 101409]